MRLPVGQRNYEEIFDNTSDCILINDMGGTIIAANRSTECIVGWPTSTLIGTQVGGYLSEDGLKIARQIRRILLSGRGKRCSYRQVVIAPEGNGVTVELVTTLVGTSRRPSGFQTIGCCVLPATEQRSPQPVGAAESLERATAVKSAPGPQLRFSLTEREEEVLRLMVLGKSNREMSTSLGITVRTVKAHLSNIYVKLNVASRTEAAIAGLKYGLVTF